MKRIWIYFILVAIFALWIFPMDSLSKGHDEIHNKGKVILVFMDRISWRDIKNNNTPNLDKLMDMGAIGLMTTNTGGSLSQNNAYLTLGAGARVMGVSGSQIALSYGEEYRGEPIEDLMYQTTGYRMAQGAIANPSIAKLLRGNANKPYKVNIGALGTALREAGLKVAILGNCDNYRRDEGGGRKNFAVSMLMDDRGIVPLGDIGDSLIMEDSTWPMGIRTDYDKMLSSIKELKNKAQVIAIQLGDTSRAEDFRHQAMDSRIDYNRIRAIEEGDKFIGRLLDDFDPQEDYMMILTPVASAKEISNNNRLTPIIIAGKGIKKGWLTSGSTHREGIVTNLDVGVSILNHFGIKPLGGQGGAPIHSVYSSEGKVGIKGSEEIIHFNDKLVNIYNQRPFLIKGYVYTLIPVLALSAIFLMFKRRYLKWVKAMLIFIMTIPLVYLLLPLLQQVQLYKTAIIAIAMAILATALLCRIFKSTEDRIMVISGLTAIGLILDQWLGMRLIQSSPLGYDVIAAARFYGMGNEYMGVLIGSACVAGGAIIGRFNKRERLTKRIMALMGLIGVYTMASPKLGANVGGTIGIFVAFATTALITQDKRVGVRSMVSIAGIIALILMGVFALDSLRVVDSQSHMGQTVNAIRENGAGELLDIFYRKISMNIRLFRTTIWTRVFLTSLGVIVLLLYRPVGIFQDVYGSHKALIRGLTGATIGSIGALLFNDSGIVAAATAMIFVAPSFVLLIMDEVQRKVKNGAWEDGIQFKTPRSGTN